MTIPTPAPNDPDNEDRGGGLRPFRARLSTKLIGGVLAILGVSLLISSLRSIEEEEQILDAQIERMGKTLSDVVSTSCVEPLLEGDYPMLQSYAQLLVRDNEEVEFVRVMLADGRIAAEFANLASGEQSFGSIRIYAAPIRVGPTAEDSLGSLILGVSTSEADRFVQGRIRTLTLDAVLCFAVMMLLMIRLLDRTVKRPVHLLHVAARRLAGGDLKTKVSLPGRDEFSDLAASLDLMRASVARSQQRIQEQNRELEEARHGADQANDTKTMFLARMSHELRTPLNAVLGIVELIICDEVAPDEREELLAVVARNGDHLLSLIDDILDISKLESGAMTVESHPFAPRQLVDEIGDLFQARAQDKGLELKLRCDPGVPECIVADPMRVRQILINLVGNALKFTESGEILVLCRTVESSPEPKIELVVADTGVGIDRSELAFIFEPFAQADESTTRKFGGSGLGLAISRHLARLLGGELTVESWPGDGSRFRLVLPAREPADGEALPARAEGQGESGSQASDLEGQRILVVDDAPDNRLLLVRILRRWGVEVVEAENGAEAVRLAHDSVAAGEAFDVILLDMQMPVLDGYQAARQLRTERYEGPIVALTAHALPEDRRKCIEAGCDEYLTKPVKRRVLRETLARLPMQAREH